MAARNGQVKVQVNYAELTQEELDQKLRVIERLTMVAALRKANRRKNVKAEPLPKKA